MNHATSPVHDWSVQEPKDRLDRGERFVVLDVRNRDEFDAWRLEGRTSPPTINVPYFEMLEEMGDDFVEAIAAYLRRELLDRLPVDLPVLAVCAKGDTSEYVAEALRRLGREAFNLRGGMQAWGDHYEVRPVAAAAEPIVLQVSRPARGCLGYIAASDGAAVVIDPLRHVDRYLDVLSDRQLELTAVLDTHAHADHVSGGPELAARVGAPYRLHAYDGIHPIDLLPAQIAFEHVGDGSVIEFGSAELRAIHIPGHTLGNLALVLDERWLFTGDSIFIGSIARPDLGGRSESWARLHYRSLRRLLALDGDLVVLPGHFSRPDEAGADGVFGARLGDLTDRNEGLGMAGRSEEEFVEYILSSLPEFPKRYIEIKRVNAGLSSADEDEMVELELGRNICALSANAGDEE